MAGLNGTVISNLVTSPFFRNLGAISDVEKRSSLPVDGKIGKDELHNVLGDTTIDSHERDYLTQIYNNYDKIATDHGGQKLIDINDLGKAVQNNVIHYNA